MDKKAIDASKLSLEKIKRAIRAMETAETFPEFDSAWSDFLMASSRIYAKLEQGAKVSGTSNAWFGRKRHDRKKDSLLSYIHHARNADEHGIEPITQHHRGSLAVKGGGHYRFDGVVGSKTDLKITHLGGPPPVVEIKQPHVRLVAVKNVRYGDTFDPPEEHLGIALAEPTPLHVATLALSYLERLVAEATELPK